MGVPERKKRNLEARETLILDCAQKYLLTQGFQNLNLDDVARDVEYSKGTIYQHFSSKEDLALAVTTRVMAERADLFERGAAFRGSTRERIRAVSFACVHFALAYPEFYHMDTTIRSSSFWERASPKRREEHSVELGRCFSAVAGVVRDARMAGDLPGDPYTIAEITASLAAATVGAEIISAMPEMAVLVGYAGPRRALFQQHLTMCDGYGWTPHSRDLDLMALDERIFTEVFPEADWFRNPAA